MTLGTLASRQEALDALGEARSDGVRGRFIDPSGTRTRVENIVEQWWLTRGGHRVSTRYRDRQVLDDNVLPVLGQAQLAQLTHAEAQAWVNGLASRFAPSSVRRSFTILRQVLDFAVPARDR
ncbi:MAG: hypothetical protein ACRDZ6_03675 [Acidimicrobiales bacterium]